MKLNLLFAAVIASLISITSCQKEYSLETGARPTDSTGTGGNDTTGAGGGNNITGDMRAKIDGVQWIADKFAGAARLVGIINISGLNVGKKTITMTLQDSGVHQYTLYYEGNNAGAFADSSLADFTAFATNGGSSAAESGGTVNITSIDEVNKKISGTFSLKVKRDTDGTSRDITEGSFTNLTYITQVAGGNATDTFRVKINGIDLNPTLITGIDVFGNLSISGAASSVYPTVGITVPSGTLPGTYSLEGMFGTHIGQYNKSSTELFAASSGSIEILELNTTTKRVRGNFNFTADPLPGTTGTSAQITQGYFAVTYQ